MLLKYSAFFFLSFFVFHAYKFSYKQELDTVDSISHLHWFLFSGLAVKGDLSANENWVLSEKQLKGRIICCLSLELNIASWLNAGQLQVHLRWFFVVVSDHGFYKGQFSK